MEACTATPFSSLAHRVRVCTALKTFLLALSLSATATYSAEAPYDLVLRNARIVDGTGNRGFGQTLRCGVTRSYTLRRRSPRPPHA
jgi:hypothetical protein